VSAFFAAKLCAECPDSENFVVREGLLGMNWVPRNPPLSLASEPGTISNSQRNKKEKRWIIAFVNLI
jgi:hypothetical protein